MGGSEIIVIILVVLLLFGAKSIPDFARMLGKGMNEFRRASDEIKREFRENTGDISDVVTDVKKDLDKEVNAISSVVEEESTDFDSFSLKKDLDEKPGKKLEEETPPAPTDNPISGEV